MVKLARKRFIQHLVDEDLPLPDTPVTHVMTPSGICTSTCLRLCSVAPRITSA